MIQTMKETAIGAKTPIICLDDDVPTFTGTNVPVSSLFDHLASGQNLRAFLDASPGIAQDHAVRAVEMASSMLEMYAYGDASVLDELSVGESVITRNPGMIWGNPAFRGTRMPVRHLFGHLASGYSITGFLSQFGTAVTYEQAAEAIRMGGRALESYAYANSH